MISFDDSGVCLSTLGWSGLLQEARISPAEHWEPTIPYLAALRLSSNVLNATNFCTRRQLSIRAPMICPNMPRMWCDPISSSTSRLDEVEELVGRREADLRRLWTLPLNFVSSDLICRRQCMRRSAVVVSGLTAARRRVSVSESSSSASDSVSTGLTSTRVLSTHSSCL